MGCRVRRKSNCAGLHEGIVSNLLCPSRKADRRPTVRAFVIYVVDSKLNENILYQRWHRYCLEGARG